jgi:hypothetical protein
VLSWPWIAGFFDGEGNISLYIRKYSIDIQVKFTQAYRPLLDELGDFLSSVLESRGVRTCVKDKRSSAYSLYVSSNHDVVTILSKMLPHLRLKQLQAKAVVDYLTDGITGDQLVDAFNAEILAGRNRGKVRPRPGHLLPRSVMVRNFRLDNLKHVHSRRRIPTSS